MLITLRCEVSRGHQTVRIVHERRRHIWSLSKPGKAIPIPAVRVSVVLVGG